MAVQLAMFDNFDPAVRASRLPQRDDDAPERRHELYPTPPWATRALFELCFRRLGVDAGNIALEPCAGLGHMAEVIGEYIPTVFAHDLLNYPLAGGGRTNNVAADYMRNSVSPTPDWIITNPPFSGSGADSARGGLGALMALKALAEARRGVAFLMRTQWMEGAARHAALFADRPPTLIAPFAERVPMTLGGWDPAATTATSYAWFIWLAGEKPRSSSELWIIPPGCRQGLARPQDAKLAARCLPNFRPAPLLAALED